MAKVGESVEPDGSKRSIFRRAWQDSRAAIAPEAPAEVDYLTDEVTAELALRFTYHPPKGDQSARYERIRADALSLAVLIAASAPDCRERSRALTALDDVVYNANAAIARRE